MRIRLTYVQLLVVLQIVLLLQVVMVLSNLYTMSEVIRLRMKQALGHGVNPD